MSGATGLIYEAFTPSTGFTVPAATAITFTFPFSSVTSGVNYYLAFFNGSTWTADTTDVGIVNGNTVSISINTPAAVNFTASTPYAFVLYSLSSTTATAAPTTSATTAPTKAPTTSATTAPTTAPTTSATTSPTTAPALATGTLSLSSTGSTSASATIEGAAGNLTLPAASQSGSIAYSISSSAPTGVTALSGVNMVYGYATITPAASFTFPINSTATASLTTTSTIPSGSFLLAYSTDGVNWVKGIGTSSTSNGTVTISASNTSGAISLTSGTKYYLAIYQ